MLKKIITLLLLFLLVNSQEQISSLKNTKVSINEQRIGQRKQNKENIKNESDKNKRLKTDFGKHNIFLQQNEKYVLTPALLFGSQSSFQIEYKLQITNIKTQPKQYENYHESKEQMKKSKSNAQKITNNHSSKTKEFYQIHPALQKISSYDLTLIEEINVTDCLNVEIFFESDQVPFLICLRKSRLLEVFKVQETRILHQFSFSVSFNCNQMSIISPTQIVFYDASNIHFYSYNRADKKVTVSYLKVQQNFMIQKCKPYIEDVANNKVKTESSDDFTSVNLQSLHLICFTNNNLISKEKNFIKIPSNESQIKKDYVIVLLLQKTKISQLDHFELPQRNSSLNHIVGFDVIDSLQNVIMICYNLYKTSGDLKEQQEFQKSESKFNYQSTETNFISSYCSIFKIYLDSSQMVLINRMLLQPSPYPLLQTSLQISVMLAVATQKTITFYHLDVLKQMFQYVQKISVPENQNFNCYEFSQLKNSFESVSLSCAKDGQESKTVSFVMVYDEDLEKYVAVGNSIIGKRFFHSGQLIFALDEFDLSLHQANQQFIVFSYIGSQAEVMIYEIPLSNPKDKGNFTSLTIFPAEHGEVYVDKLLPFLMETNYDSETYLDLKGSFEGSNISFVKVQVSDEKGNPIYNNKYIDQDRIYSYEYSLLLSIYIKQQCIRVIKIDDSSFYRILRIEKSRVDEAQAGNEIGDKGYERNQQKQQNDQKTMDDQQIEYYYYTETCNKIQGSYICQLSQVHSINSAQTQNKNKKALEIQSSGPNKVIDIDFLVQSNMFVYLYQWKNTIQSQKSSQNISPLNYGLMFVNMIDNGEQTTLHCYELKFLIQDIYQKVLFSQVDQEIMNISEVGLSKNWLYFEISYSLKYVRVYCLLNNVKTYFFASDQINSTLHIEKSCLIIHDNNKLSQTKEFIQDNRLIVSQMIVSLQPSKISRKLTIFNIINNDQIIKQGVYYIQNDKDSLTKPNTEGQFIGLYKQYMIVVNETTIRKYHMGIKSQLLYQFVYNPQFLQSYSYNKKSQNDSFSVKYVLFLQKYLIVQFESFYQLYDIGEQLISIQIAANNFNAYLQSLSHEERIKFSRGKLSSSDRIQNVIINDAFLIEGDNIVIYEKDHLVVAKYITNPSLKLGSFDLNHHLVQKDLQLKLTPVLDFFSDNDEVSQQVMLKIYYSHYIVQKIAKNIKILTVPSQTENYQLEIWTNVFRGPILQYYLSDTFDGEIVLKQHIQDISDPINKRNQNQNDFIIIQHHKPFDTQYVIKRNSSHLFIQVNKGQLDSISNQQIKQHYYIALNKQLASQIFFKFVHFHSRAQNNTEIICILGQKSVIFLRFSQQSKDYSKKFTILGSVFHNISMQMNANDIVSSVQIQVLPKRNSQESSNNKEAFIISLLGSQNHQKSSEDIKITYPTFIQLFEAELDFNLQENKIVVTKTQQLLIGQEILQIRSIQNEKPELIVLTYLQSLRFYEISGDNEQSFLKFRQSVSLKDIIPAEFRSDNEKYVKFEIFKQQNYEDKINVQNITLLAFSQTDKAFHIEFEVFQKNSDEYNTTLKYEFNLKNIYAGYPNYKFVSVVKIGFEDKRKNKKLHSTINDKNNHNNTTNSEQISSQKPSYIYFITINEYETTQQIYLTYYTFNYNYSINGQVGYFKCGQKISPQQQDDDENDEEFRMRQLMESNNKEQKLLIENSSNQKSSKNVNISRYIVSLEANDRLNVQLVNFTQSLTNSTKYSLSQSIQNIVLQYNLQINTSIYMILNYQKPPIVSYILLNARNFNVRAGIYTKFIFIQQQVTWTAFYIVFPIVMLLLISCCVMLKKHQPKDLLYMEKSKPSIEEIIYSDESRTTKNKQQRVICIGSSDDEQNSNYRGSMEIEESPRFGYVAPDIYNKNKQSSVLQSPFRTVHGRDSHFPQDIDESDIQQTPKIKLITMQNEHHDDHQEDKEILSYLISKKGSFASNTSSFA